MLWLLLLLLMLLIPVIVAISVWRDMRHEEASTELPCVVVRSRQAREQHLP